MDIINLSTRHNSLTRIVYLSNVDFRRDLRSPSPAQGESSTFDDSPLAYEKRGNRQTWQVGGAVRSHIELMGWWIVCLLFAIGTAMIIARF